MDDLEQQADDLEEKARAIRQIVSGLRSLNGDSHPRRSFASHRVTFEIAPRDEDGPRGPQAVLAVMGEEPEREWKVVELKHEMLRRGWAPTPKAVEASVKRLRMNGQVEPKAYGYYKLAPKDAPSLDGAVRLAS